MDDGQINHMAMYEGGISAAQPYKTASLHSVINAFCKLNYLKLLPVQEY